jgi:methionyl-tRNA formyltransferase
MRLLFLGTPAFAVPTLEALVAAGHQVEAVFTQPDRPKGRGQALAFSPVKQAALRMGLRVEQPERIRRPEAVELVRSFAVEAMVVVGYGQIIPQVIIDMPRHGILNVHASLLPRYRGAAPIQWAVANGETRTGVTIMRIDAGLDTGDMLAKAETAIAPAETAIELGERLAGMGAALLVETLGRIAEIAAEPQPPAEATYAPILKKEDGRVDWTAPASQIHNRARGLLPWPGAWSAFRGQLLHLWRTAPVEQATTARPGTLVAGKRRLYVACASGSMLELVEVQLEGRKRVSGEAFLNGQRLAENESLGDQNT